VKQDREQEQEWLRQNSLGFGALIAVGVVMVQPFLTAASLDASARICVVAFSVAIPLLAALTLVNRQEAFRRRRAKSVVVAVTQVAAQLSAFVGVVAGFWHILWIAGWAYWRPGSWGLRSTRQATRAWNGIRRQRPRKPENRPRRRCTAAALRRAGRPPLPVGQDQDGVSGLRASIKSRWACDANDPSALMRSCRAASSPRYRVTLNPGIVQTTFRRK
jgi:hypothetical protein